MKVTQKEKKHRNEKEPQRKFSINSYAPKNTSHHQMKMKSVTVRQEEFYSWKRNIMTRKIPKKNMNNPKKDMKKSKMKLKRQKLTIEKN